MADIIWPEGLIPFRASFYLQPHVGGTESPFTRTRKVYGLSRPRWKCSLTFRGGYDGYEGVQAYGPLLDSLIVRMAGGLNRVLLWDFRRPYPVGLRRYYEQFGANLYTFGGGETFSLGERFAIPEDAEPLNEFAAIGSDAIIFSGFRAGERVFNIGDYFGGDGRCHIFHNIGIADADGRVSMRFDPPLQRDLQAGAARTMQPETPFRLDGEDAGNAMAEINQLSQYTLEFTEDLA